MKSVLNVKGQATVEAILMLVLGVAMVLGLMKGFSESFRKFTDVYFGNYFHCLISNGELPRLKRKEKDNRVCDSQYKSFSLSKGWAKNSGVNSSGNTAGSKKDGNGGGGGKKSRPTRGIRETGFNKNRFIVRPRSGSSSSGKSGSEKKQNSSDTDYQGSNVGTYGGLSNGNDGVVRVIRIRRRSKDERNSAYGLYKDPGDKKIKIKGSLKKSNLSGSGGNKKGLLQINKTVAKVKKKKEKGFEFSFSGIMRFLIIAALIIVIIIVIGGQLLSISKSFE